MESYIVIISSGITAVATIIAAKLASSYKEKTNKISKQLNEKSDTIKKISNEMEIIYQQLAAYHELETNYAEKLSKIEGCAPKTIKTKFRDMVYAELKIRPEFTRKYAEKRILEIKSNANLR